MEWLSLDDQENSFRPGHRVNAEFGILLRSGEDRQKEYRQEHQ
jgi:hypothetical protein